MSKPTGNKTGRPKGSGTRPVIGTSIGTGDKIHLAGRADIENAGFQQASIWRCLTGKKKQHGGFTWAYADGKPPTVAGPRKRNCNARAVIGTHLTTGEVIRLVGGREITLAGFNQSAVSRVTKGEYSHHHGYSWEYEDEMLARKKHNLRAAAKEI